MILQLLKPAKSLNKAYFKQSLKTEQIELFKTELQKTFAHIDENQDEEYHKNIIAQFLISVYCKDKYLVNVNKKQDLVIRNGNKINDDVAVILEFKKPTGKKDMVSEENANVKALHELVLYYLRETVDNNNHEIKYLIATNIYEWFVFDGVWFEKNIYNNTELKKDYQNWDITKHGTEHFYKFIAAKHLDLIEEEVPCTYFNLKDAEKILNNTELNEKDEETIINLFKILSPEHLLKKPFINDSNTLNKEFYNELLHIIGLEETKDNNKKIIERKKVEDRNDGSLIENTITVLKRSKYFGYSTDEETEQKYFGLALELNITWLNRILFLKLLEGQLIKYNNSTAFSFLNINRIKDFDELDEFFFEVLAVPDSERENSLAKLFDNIPYLNSSLFEPTDKEKIHQGIKQLKDRLSLPVYGSTVLKDGKGKRITGNMTTLQYLFDFLDAYDFASESSAKIQKENKNVINASVLGLIFEKINGYKNGSFFTPGFITMYMCRETIHKAVVQKFNDANKWNCKNIKDIQEKIDFTDKDERIKANNIINSIKICDPAVGSGHFLVSALNELIAIKSDLRILQDREGRLIRQYKAIVINDELYVYDVDDETQFEYSAPKKNRDKSIQYQFGGDKFTAKLPISEKQLLQEALFHEKQSLIENCLFGVDINPKSVMICRLRLWIELLKNSYYTKVSNYEHLETLPNIDINIKCGNSLISRFAIDSDLKQIAKSTKWSIFSYRNAVESYKKSPDKKVKNEIEKLIKEIKTNYVNTIQQKNPLLRKYYILKNEFDYKYPVNGLFAHEPESNFGGNSKKREEEKQKLSAEIQKLLQEIEDEKTFYERHNAFEWRFEFPEVLNENGEFIGFDVLIGNPPYIVIKGGRYTGGEFIKEVIDFLKTNYNTGKQQINTYTLFIELSNRISSKSSVCCLIIPNTFLANEYSFAIREFLTSNFSIYELNNVGLVFEEANVETTIIFYGKHKSNQTLIKNKSGDYFINLSEIINFTEDKKFLILLSKKKAGIIKKLNQFSKLKLFAKVWRGLTTGNDKKYLSDNFYNSNHKPLITGSEIERYSKPVNKKFVLYLSEELDRSRDERIFLLKEKLISKFVGVRLCFAYDNNKYYILNSCCITELINNQVKIKYLLGLLNSELINFYFSNVFTDYRETFPIMKSGNIENLPIKLADNKTQNKIEKLVDEILKKKEKNNSTDTSELENKIDQMVYKLYGITPDEQKIIKES